jgi:hypothetical protein
VSDLELAVGTGTLCMDDSLGNSLACRGRRLVSRYYIAAGSCTVNRISRL